MSQIYKILTSGGPIPPVIPTQFTTDIGDNDPTVTPGTAIPSNNNLNVLGRDTSQNNDNGIRTDADPDGDDNLFIELTNRFTGAVTTVDATPTTLASLDLSTIGEGVFTFDAQISGFDTTDNEGVGYAIFGSAKNIGGTVTIIGTPDKVVNEDIAPVDITAADANLVASGTSVVVQVTGIALTTFNWNSVTTYVYVGP